MIKDTYLDGMSKEASDEIRRQIGICKPKYKTFETIFGKKIPKE